MLRRFLSLMVVLTIPVVASAAESQTGFVTKEFANEDKSISKYVVFVPAAYDGKTEFPVILFLHGSGETKGGTKMPVEVGLGPVIKKQEKTFPYIVVIPQAEKRPWSAGSVDGKRAMQMLDDTMKAYKTDAKRVILTGLSMGGYGTWSHAAAFPDKWAAIVPVCGGGNAKDAEKIKDIPCWNFHGDKDTAVKVELSRTMIEALKKAGGKPKYTEYEGVGHNSWDSAYGDKELWKWLAEQKKN